MTAMKVILDLLQYIGVSGFAAVDGANALNRPGLDDQDVDKALAALNQALQEIQKYGPHSLRRGERAAFFNLPAPVRINADATMNQSITMTTTPPPWIVGCSILVDGDNQLNRIVDVTGYALSLLRGYRGPTANGVGAVIYADCALLQQDILRVLAPVTASPGFRIRLARDLDEFLQTDYRFRTPIQNISSNIGQSKQIGTPVLYFVERRFDGALYLRLNPMPALATNITFECELAAQRIDVGALDQSGNNNDPGVEFVGLSVNNVESILLPIARGKFLSHPSIKNMETRRQLQTAHDAAMQKLEYGSSFDVVTDDQRARYI